MNMTQEASLSTPMMFLLKCHNRCAHSHEVLIRSNSSLLLTAETDPGPPPPSTGLARIERPTLDRVNTEPSSSDRLMRTDASPDQNMAPPSEDRRSITTYSTSRRRLSASTFKSLPTPTTATPKNSVASSRSKSIAEDFARYTQLVVNTAAQTVHRDAVRTRVEKQSTEKDRWQKHYRGFATMAEEQTRQLKKSEASSKYLEDSLKEIEKAQARSIENIASTMSVADNCKSAPALEDSTQKDMATLWEEFVATRRTVWTLDNMMQDMMRTNGKVNGRLEELLQEVRCDYVSKQTFTAAESILAEAAVNIHESQASSMEHNELKNQVSDLRNQFVSMTAFEGHDTLIDRVLKIEDKLNRLDNVDFHRAREEVIKVSADAVAREASSQQLKEKLESHVQEFQTWKAEVTEHIEKSQELNDFVTGDKNSLYDMVQEGIKKSNKHADALQNLNNELGEFDILKEEIRNIRGSLTRLNAHPPNQSPNLSDHKPSGSPEAHLPDQSPNLSNFKSLGSLDIEVAILKADVARIAREQQAKDDMMAEEVDRLANLLSAKNTEIERLSMRLDGQDTLINDRTSQISNLQSHVNGIRLPEGSALRPKMEELETSLKQFKDFSLEKMSNTETFVISQEQRFNNLTTEPMARSIINQMQRLYPPHPGTLMADINQIKGHQQALHDLWAMLDRRMQVISDYVGSSDELSPQKHTIPDLQAALRTVSNKIDGMSQLHQSSSSFIKETNALVLDHSTKIERFETDISSMKNEHLSAIEASKADLQAIKANVNEVEAATIQECSNLMSEITTLSEQVQRMPGSQTHRNASTTKDAKSHPCADNDSDIPVSSPAQSSNKLRRSKHHLQLNESEDDAYSPSRHRAGSVRSAASAAKVKLASTAVTVNGNGQDASPPAKKARKKRDRSEGEESEWCPN